MSGHSKWSTIKHKKAVIDSKRSGVFTKMANAISVAVKKGGGIGDPEMNFALRLAVDKARAVNMPKENIERAIDKGMGKGADGRGIEELVLEGYGPGGVAIVIEAVTDNRNRTVAELKNILEKQGGRLGEPGSVMYQFERVGQVVFTGSLSDEEELNLIDKGLTEVEVEEDKTIVYCGIADLQTVSSGLSGLGKEEVESQIVYRPKTRVRAVNDETLENLLEALSDYEDVQEVYDNAL